MSDKVTDLTDNQTRVLPYLLAHPNISEACRKAKIAPKTVYGWLHESKTFREALQAQRSAIADAALDGLKGRIEQAVETLANLLTAKNEGVRRAAARDIVDISLRLRETEEVERRLKGIERMLETREAKKERTART